MEVNSGKKANWTGKNFENFVYDNLIRMGFQFIDNKEFERAMGFHLFSQSNFIQFPDSSVSQWFTTQFNLTDTIYGTKWKVDFLLHNVKRRKSLVIECKWQQSPGSVDEKYPYLVANIKSQSPYPAIIILDGDGYKPNAKEWLKTQVDEKLIGVFNMSEFFKWIPEQKYI